MVAIGPAPCPARGVCTGSSQNVNDCVKKNCCFSPICYRTAPPFGRSPAERLQPARAGHRRQRVHQPSPATTSSSTGQYRCPLPRRIASTRRSRVTSAPAAPTPPARAKLEGVAEVLERILGAKRV